MKRLWGAIEEALEAQVGAEALAMAPAGRDPRKGM